ncbi:MAG TPA: hypothetical protein HA362_01345 [Nanoarchaeota archaeon]|nr:hypothetical protein [Nanoarchaeota archaeon]
MRKLLVLWLLVIGIALLLTSCAKETPEEGGSASDVCSIEKPSCGQDSCTAKEDCVAASCCHPLSVVNKAYAPDCSGIMCTMVCSGPLDCGAGSIECVDGKCVIEASK